MMNTVMQAVRPPKLDIGPIIFDTHTSFNPLSKDFMFDFEVSEIRDGYVVLSLALPEGMVRVFAAMLESMSGLFKFMDRKVKIAATVEKSRQRTIDPAIKAFNDKARQDFKDKVGSLYNGFLDQGHTSAEAVKLTNSTLKAKNHPWAGYEMVKSVLSSTGQFKKKKEVV
jgi:hypothetical protein